MMRNWSHSAAALHMRHWSLTVGLPLTLETCMKRHQDRHMLALNISHAFKNWWGLTFKTEFTTFLTFQMNHIAQFHTTYNFKEGVLTVYINTWQTTAHYSAICYECHQTIDCLSVLGLLHVHLQFKTSLENLSETVSF